MSYVPQPKVTRATQRNALKWEKIRKLWKLDEYEATLNNKERGE